MFLLRPEAGRSPVRKEVRFPLPPVAEKALKTVPGSAVYLVLQTVLKWVPCLALKTARCLALW